MIDSSNVSLPYPVLGLEDDFKEGSFEVRPAVQVVDDILDISEQEVTITNEYIKKLYEDDLVTTAYKIVCPSTLYSLSVSDKKEIKISMDLLANHIEMEVFLIAKSDISDYSDESFNDDYFLGDNKGVFNVESGNIIGFAGSKKIPLKQSFAKGASSMFSWQRGNDLPMSFDVNDRAKIVITYPYNEEQSLDVTRVLPQQNKMTFLNLFILPALNSAFAQLIVEAEEDTIDDFCLTHEWALILTETYPEWQDEDTYRSAQYYLQSLLSGRGNLSKTPVLEAFEELKK